MKKQQVFDQQNPDVIRAVAGVCVEQQNRGAFRALWIMLLIVAVIVGQFVFERFVLNQSKPTEAVATDKK